MQLITSENLSRIKKNRFSITLLFFISCFYYAPSNKFLNNVFYALIFLPFCIYAVTHKQDWLAIIMRYRFYAGLGAALFFSSLLNTATPSELGYQLSRLLYVTGFIGTIALAVRDNPKLPRQLLHTLVYSAFVGAIICISVAYFQNGHLQNRLRGWGALDNPILLSSIHAIAIFSAIYIFVSLKNKIAWIYLLLATPSIAVVFLSQSRGPLLALAVTSSAYFFTAIRHSRRAMGLTIGLTASVMLIIIILFFANTDARLLSLDGPRPAIWEQAIGKISEKPFMGHGLQEKTYINAPIKVKTKNGIIERMQDFQHPHNVYLTTLFHGGVLALGLFGVLLVNSFRSRGEASACHFLLLFGLIYILFDGSRLFTSPKELWLVIWLPVGILLAKSSEINDISKIE